MDLSCFFETFPGVKLGGWFDIAIVMKKKNKSSAFDSYFDWGLWACQKVKEQQNLGNESFLIYMSKISNKQK